MNKLLISCLLILLILFAQCKPNKEPTPVTPQTQENSIRKLLLGKWTITFSAYDDNMNGVPDDSEKEFGDEPAFATFNIDGSFLVTDAQGVEGGPANKQWSLNDKVITITIPTDSFNDAFSESYAITSLSTIDMLWKLQEDSTNISFIGFSR